MDITARLLIFGGLAVFGLTKPVIAEPETPSSSFLVYVEQEAPSVSLAPSEHLLVFRMAVQVPGARLQPGSYIFRLLTPSIVQVMNVTRSIIYATFFTLREFGDGDTRRERIKFAQNPEDNFAKIVGWYLPGGTGYGFLFPTPKRKPAERVRER